MKVISHRNTRVTKDYKTQRIIDLVKKICYSVNILSYIKKLCYDKYWSRFVI